MNGFVEGDWILVTIKGFLRAGLIAQWKNERIPLSVFSMVRAQSPAVTKYFMGISLADHTNLERVWVPPNRHKPH